MSKCPCSLPGRQPPILPPSSKCAMCSLSPLSSGLGYPTGRTSAISAFQALGCRAQKNPPRSALGCQKIMQQVPGAPCKKQLPPPRATRRRFFGGTRCHPHPPPSHSSGPCAIRTQMMGVKRQQPCSAVLPGFWPR